MKTNKRVISLLLTLALVLSCLPGIALLASAAEIEKPAGISIVEDFDVFVGAIDWVTKTEAALPATVKVDGVDTAVTWGSVKTHVDVNTPGYYALPGTVEGVDEPVYITIQVREKINLLADYDPSFEDKNAKYGYSSPWTNSYAATTGFITPVTDPVQDGEYSRQFNFTGSATNTQLTYNKSELKAPFAELLNASGSGEYALSMWGRVNADAVDNHRLLAGAAVTLDDGTKLETVPGHQPLMESTYWSSSYLNFTFPENAVASELSIWAMVSFPNGGNGDLIYLDNFELVKVDILELEEEPAVLTEVTTELAPVAVIKDYDSYYPDWKAQFDLPATVTVAGSDGTTGTANVAWNYAGLDFSKPGKYTLTGKIASLDYLNADGLTVEQVIIVKEKENLIYNGDFTEKTNAYGAPGWTMSWTRYIMADPDNADNNVIRFTRGGTVTASQIIYPNADGISKLTSGIRTAGVGQYYMQFDAKAVAYVNGDTNVPAREDTQLWPVMMAAAAEGATSGYSALKDATGALVTLTTEWQTIGHQFDITELYGSYRMDIKGKVPTAPVYFYMDNIEVFALKVTLAMPADCEHTDRLTQVIAPTCTEAGYTVNYCPLCGDSYNNNEVAALGHTAGEAVIENEKAPTCVAAGSYDSVVYCTVCDAKISSTTMTGDPATGEHNYVDGVCDVCGAEEVTGPAVDENLKFNAAPGLSFKDYIGMQILVTSAVAQNYDRVWIEAVQADPAGDVTTTLEGVSYYYGIYLKFEQQVLSWSMAENITLTLWAEKDGETVKGETFSGSVEDLALEKIASYAAANNTAAVTALVDMLNYGAAVQTSFNHNADMLPNTNLGSYTGTTATPEFDATNSITGTGSLTVASNSISMQAKVEIQLLIMGKIDGYTVSAKVGGADAPVVVDTEKYAGYGWTLVKVAVAADKMRQTYTISVNDANGTPVTPVYNVSVEAYGKTQLEGAKADVVIAMMRYGDSVAAL